MLRINKLLMYIYLTFLYIKTLDGYMYESDSDIVRIRRESRNGHTSRNGSCVLPEYPKNGVYFVYGTDETYSPGMQISDGEILIVECKNGYRLYGVVHILCSNEAWSYPLGQCLIPSGNRSCILPEHPKNGEWIVYRALIPYYPGNETSDGDVLYIECNDEYALDGINIISCMDGTWSAPIGKCLRPGLKKNKSCTLPEHPINGKWSVYKSAKSFSPGSEIIHGSILVVNCSRDYALDGISIISCIDGIWSFPIGKCLLRPGLKKNKSCTLPEHPINGKWSVYKSAKSFSPGSKIIHESTLVVNCSSGYALDGISIISCIDGTWSFPIGECLRTCPPRSNTPLITVTCIYNNKELSHCTNPVEGTLAKFKCASFYEDPSLNRHPVHVCKDGVWNYQTPKCIPACGLKSVSTQTLIINGTNVKAGDYPWQVAIYYTKKQDKQLICGGSLISPRVILTAAHCITDESGKLKPKGNYIVAVGKYYRKYDDDRDKNFAQFSKLRQHFISKHYKGPMQNYLGDIAILVTKKTFQLSLRVQPVCVDWGSNYHILGEYGYVTGWGLTSETENPSEELKELKVPLTPAEKCTQELPEDYHIYLTHDKLCTEYLDRGSAVCKGDSGGGLVVKRSNGRYFITGIVSLSPQSPSGGCDKQQYGLFTRVEDYIQFISEIEAQFPSY